MTYEERIKQIKSWFLADITPRFTNPTGLDPKIAASDTIEAVNSNLPSPTEPHRLSQFLALITKELTRSARSRTLPPVRDFVAAAAKASQSAYSGGYTAANADSTPTPIRIAAARIRRGEAVSDYYITGSGRSLMKKEGVTDDELKRYDLAIAAHKQHTDEW